MRATGDTTQCVEVRTDTLANIFREHGIRAVDYMTIDTEGSEEAVLRGIGFDAVRIGVLQIEVNFPKDAEPLRSFLRKKSFLYDSIQGVDQVWHHQDYRKATAVA